LESSEGRHEKLGDLEVYISEPAENSHPKEAVISIYDIVGWGAAQNFMVGSDVFDLEFG
jgi:hypothetical protein